MEYSNERLLAKGRSGRRERKREGGNDVRVKLNKSRPSSSVHPLRDMVGVEETHEEACIGSVDGGKREKMGGLKRRRE